MTDITKLAHQLHQTHINTDVTLLLLLSSSKNDLLVHEKRRVSIITQCVRFSQNALQTNRFAHLALIFTFIHVSNSRDQWLLTSSQLLLPVLRSYYDAIVTHSNIPNISTPIPSSSNPLPLVKPNVHALRALANIFELCVDFCDAIPNENHLRRFVKPSAAILSFSQFHTRRHTLTKTDYVLDELMRSASYALSNILLSFDSIAAGIIGMPPKYVTYFFDALFYAPELSIKTSLVLILKVLHQNTSRSKHQLSTSHKSATNFAHLIQQKLSLPKFGSKKAIPSFLQLNISAPDAALQCEHIISTMFSRTRKALKCFRTHFCNVKITNSDPFRKRNNFSGLVSVDWNMNGIVVRRDSDLPSHFPFLAISEVDWRQNWNELHLTYNSLFLSPELNILIRFQSKSATRRDKQVIEDRIEKIMSAISDSPDSDLETKAPPESGLNEKAGALRVSFQQQRSLEDHKTSEKEADKPDGELRTIKDKQRIPTILSSLGGDGVFFKKPYSSAASSVISSHSEVPEKLPEFRENLPEGEGKLSEGEGKLPEGEEKLSEGEEKLPEGEEKLSVSTEKLPVSTEKLPVSAEKLPISTEEFPGSTGKLLESTEKVPECTDMLPVCTRSVLVRKEKRDVRPDGDQIEINTPGVENTETNKAGKKKAVSYDDSDRSAAAKLDRCKRKGNRLGSLVGQKRKIMDREEEMLDDTGFKRFMTSGNSEISFSPSAAKRKTSVHNMHEMQKPEEPKNARPEIEEVREAEQCDEISLTRGYDMVDASESCSETASLGISVSKPSSPHATPESSERNSIEDQIIEDFDNRVETAPEQDLQQPSEVYCENDELQNGFGEQSPDTVNTEELLISSKQNAKLRQTLQSTVVRMISWKDAKSKEMIQASKAQIEKIRRAKGAEVEMLAEKAKNAIAARCLQEQSELRKRAAKCMSEISKGRQRIKGLMKTQVIEKRRELKLMNLKTKKSLGRTMKQLEAMRKELNEDLNKLLPDNKKKTESRTEKGSLFKDLLRMLDGETTL